MAHCIHEGSVIHRHADEIGSVCHQSRCYRDTKRDLAILLSLRALSCHSTSIDSCLRKKFFCAVKITGECSYLEVRSPPKQAMPYPPLSDALKNQSIFELHNVTGTFVGFFAPQYANGFCVPGWDFHFLTTDDEYGGHVLELTLHTPRYK